MRLPTILRSLFYTLARKTELNADLDAELESYVELLAAEKEAGGMPPAEALRQAKRELGGVEQVKAEVHDRRVGASLDSLLQDIRFASRQLRRNPGFAAVAIATLALGIGANTAVFSVVSAVLLRPLPYAEEDRVVAVWNTHVEGQLGLSEQEYNAYEELPQFDALGVYVSGSLALSGTGEAERLSGIFADATVLETIGAPAIAGRAYSADEDVPGVEMVVLISESLWERRFGREQDVLGRALTLNGVPRTVVGVTPTGFRLPGGFSGPAPDFIAPLRLDRAAPDPRNIHYLNAIGRMAPGVTVGQASAALDAAAGRMKEQLGTLPETFSALAVPVRDEVVGGVRTALLILLGAVTLVLLVACVNLANLLLARSDTRIREMAVRTSLGAGRRRIARQLCTETSVLAVGGGIAGLLAGMAGARALATLSPPGIPRLDGSGVDVRVFFFCLVATLLTALVIGLVPALRLMRSEPGDALRGARSSPGGRDGVRARRGLVTAQVALATMLAIGAGLLARSLAELRSVDPGFEPAGVLTFQLSLPASEYPGASDVRAYFERFETTLIAVPGIEAAGATTSLPLASGIGDWGVRIRGRGPDGLGERGPAPDWMVVTPGYFDAMGIPVVEGRTYDRSDVADGFQTVVISREFARRHWPAGDALGAEIRMSTNIDTLWRTVVGVVADVHQTSLEEVPRPAMYLPHTQFPSTTTDVVVGQMTLAVRTGPDQAASLATTVRAIASDLDSDVPVADVRTMREVTRDATASHTFQGLLFTGFAGLALVLVVVGVYGVTSYLVARRTREIGIRIALGASPGGVRSLVMREGALVTGVGLALGIAGAWMLSRLMAGTLYGVTARDPITFVAVPVVLSITVLFAVAIPATRAARVDPQEALRAE
jgi:predicted permease